MDSLKSGKDRGMSKIRKDIITRPTEGMIDMTEPAFDVANIYVSIQTYGLNFLYKYKKENSVFVLIYNL